MVEKFEDRHEHDEDKNIDHREHEKNKENKDYSSDYRNRELDRLKANVNKEQMKHTIESKTHGEIYELQSHIQHKKSETYKPNTTHYEEMNEEEITHLAMENRNKIEQEMKHRVSVNPFIPQWLKEKANA